MSGRNKKFVDAYGEELWSFYKKDGKFEIIERDDGYIEAGQRGLEYIAGYKDWPGSHKKAIKYAKGRVLDIGCGAGRHSLYLQKKGFDATGIDNSPLAIKISKLRGLKKAKVMPIHEIGKFHRNSFDSVIMMGNNFGLFGSFNKARQLLKVLHNITSDRALIIAETRNPYGTKDINHLEYHKLNRKRGRMAGQLKIRVRHKRFVGPWFDYLMISQKELKEILKGTGWKLKKIIGPADAQYIAVIRKV